MKTYRGTRESSGVCVTVATDEGTDRLLGKCLDIRNHSPTGFDWGYGGSGPAQLALAILADLRGRHFAEQWYQLFKWEVVSKLPHAAWALTESEINAALEHITAGAPGAGGDEEVWEPTEESQVIE